MSGSNDMRKLCFATLCASALLLSGCLFPEKFKAKIDVNPDASYLVKFDGTVAAIPVLMGMDGKKHSLNPQDEKALQKDVPSLSKMPGVKKVSYIGNARYQIDIDLMRPAKAPLNLFDVLMVRTDKDGVMTIATPKFSAADIKQISQLGLAPDGLLEVTLPKNAEVIESNATTSPSFFGLFNKYAWKIGDLQTRPMMRLKFKS